MEAQQQVRDDVPQSTFTRWYNPTDKPQRAVLTGPAGKFAFVVEPGETRELDSIYDRAIQMVSCGREECQKKGGWWCTKGHEGLVKGGLAPLLKRVGKEDRLDPVLDPNLADAKMREEALAADSLVRKARDQALVIATAKLDEEESQRALAQERARAAQQAAAVRGDGEAPKQEGASAPTGRRTRS